MFQIDAEADTARRPDLAFITAARWPLDSPVPRDNAWPIVPDLAVEVISPVNSADEIATKLPRRRPTSLGPLPEDLQAR